MGKIMKTFKLHTVQISKWRLVRELGIHLLDITAKSGNAAFAPRYADVMAFKHHEMTWEEYEARYRMKMRESQREAPQEWAKLLDLPQQVALACYCPAGAKCHRFPFRDILTEYYQQHHADAVNGREITGYFNNDNVTELPDHVPQS